MNDGKIIDGRAIAAELRRRVGSVVATLKTKRGLVPGLAVVLVGEDPGSQIYVRIKKRETITAGMNSIVHALPASTSQTELLSLIDRLNCDNAVHGILMQLPLPPHIDAHQVVDAIDPAKDVDGLHPINIGQMAANREAIVPCTPLGCLLLLRHCLNDLTGRHALVLGRSNLVGKPMAHLLLRENCTVTMAHSRSQDLPDMCRQADILVAAVGKPALVRGTWIKPGAAVIDVGITSVSAPTQDNPDATRLTGDVAFEEALPVAGAISPVPGGVGPMTIACLLINTLNAASRQHERLAGVTETFDLPFEI